MTKVTNLAQQFVNLALNIGALRLLPNGVKLNSGRISPYFFNAGLFDSGSYLYKLARLYAGAIMEMENGNPSTSLIYGQAYKGCAIAPATAIVFDHTFQRPMNYAFNRKEPKDHGEGGQIVGCPLKDHRVVIVDDVTTNGQTKREAIKIVQDNGGTATGIVIAFDRQEVVREGDPRSARMQLEDELDIPVVTIATATDLLAVLEQRLEDQLVGQTYPLIKKYLEEWGAHT